MSKNKEFQQFYTKVQQFAETDPTVQSTDTETQKLKVLQEKFVLLDGTTALVETWAKDHCGLVTIPVMPFANVLYLQKHSPYTAMVSEQ